MFPKGRWCVEEIVRLLVQASFKYVNLQAAKKVRLRLWRMAAE
jgi:hypothetical protein